MESRERRYFLMVDMHHIISDGISHDILAKDFIAYYRGQSLPPLRIQYKDFSQWQDHEKEKEVIKQQETHWLDEFAGDIPVLNLPTDYPRPTVRSFEGNSVTFELSPRQTTALTNLALKQGATLYMLLVGVINILLAKLSCQEDIVMGVGWL